LNVGGKADSFRFLDPKDCQAVNQLCAPVTDSPYTGRVYQLQKTWAIGIRSYTKAVVKPVTTAVVKFDGTYCTSEPVIEVGGSVVTGWTLDSTTGLLTLAAGAGYSPVTWSGKYHYPVRFDTDDCNAVIEESDVADGNALVSWPDVTLVEVRLLSTGAGSLGA
jgi:uncharacterized protein (TIGR02217 family)